MKFLIARKIDMTQEFAPDGTATSVTVLEVLPNVITQVKTAEKDGYRAVQLGTGTRKEKNVSKAVKGHLQGKGPFRVLREFRLDDVKGQESDIHFEQGQELNASVFESGEMVDVVGTSHGRGFTGVVKRHGFHGSPATHGHKDQLRMPGSIGAQQPQRVRKGKRMAGHMGNERVTVKNITVMSVSPEAERLTVKGAVPGVRGTTVLVMSAKNPRKGVVSTRKKT